MNLRFLSLASGSSGNCYYLGNDEYGILIDAGIGIRTIKKHLKEHNIPFENIVGLCITHDHADHIKAVGHLGEKHGIPVYTTPEIHEGMKHSYCMTERLSPERTRFIRKEETFSVGDFTITCFEVPHDGTDNVGYRITAGDKTFSFLTDIGHITPTASRFIQQADYLILDAAHAGALCQTAEIDGDCRGNDHNKSGISHVVENPALFRFGEPLGGIFCLFHMKYSFVFYSWR